MSDEVNGLRRSLSAPSLDRIPPHITLVPPVNVSPDQFDLAIEDIAHVAASTVLPPLELGPVSTFWPDNPVVYLAVSESLASTEVAPSALGRLRQALLAGPLYRPDSRAFVPHVTIADQVAPDRIPGILTALDGYRTTVVIETVHLLRLGADRVWTSVADFALAPPVVRARGGLELELTGAVRPDPGVTDWVEATARIAGTPTWPGPAPGQVAGAVPPETSLVSSYTFMARREKSLVGVARTQWGHWGLHLEHLIVSPDRLGQGIGSALLVEVEAWAARCGSRARSPSDSVVVTALVQGGTRMEKFLIGRGFHRSGMAAGTTAGDDCVLMTRAVQVSEHSGRS
ncbi:MAG: GNAT family N-acetyltransferase [Acidimicrobiales bacterium]